MEVPYVNMATASNSEKIIGVIGIAAAIVFIVAMLIAIVETNDFTFGSGTMSDLFPNTALVAGSVIAGILGALFGLLITLGKEESKVFIGNIRGLLMILAGAALVVMGATKGNEWVVYLAVALIILSAIADTFYNWVVDQKMLMLVSLVLTVIIAITGIASQATVNPAMGFVFAVFAAVWIVFLAVMRFVPVVEAEPLKKDKKGKAKEETKKKNAPAPRPYPTKKAEPKKAETKPAEKEKPKKAEPKKAEPKKTETKPVPEAEKPKKKEPEPEPKPKEEPIKVMSSREAAAARETVRKKDEPAAPAPAPAVQEAAVVVEAEPKPVPEPVKEPDIVAMEEAEEAETFTEEEGSEEPFDILEDTPDALLRRATWNKGLRCRRDYGEAQIPIAYVKAKVAVYVQKEPGADDASVDEKLRSKGWTVFRYKESDITDGKDQAEEISKAVKENLRAERAKKKKSSKK